ncbi:hypothetical protein NLJ89_g10240 [Agrocybe chaxingu]|uniref:HpcH/HpaI aldolase/citrate lyase domain-containing protein n=1 Tax=Agrocybe chaxingu TaxID=84603 RepID=A0A9W8MP44_9AGAR|nr:hypothetical protein NLJ89_g10240 [Agrocybe chaxingu]
MHLIPPFQNTWMEDGRRRTSRWGKMVKNLSSSSRSLVCVSLRTGGAYPVTSGEKSASSSWQIKHALDGGAHGVLVPLVSTAEKAKEVVSDCRFPPLGRRGFGSPFTHGIWGVSAADYLKAANDTILVMVQIENKEAVENVGEIAAVDGVDVLFIGPYDLSISLGYPTPNPDPHPDVEQVIQKILRAAHAKNKKCAIFCTSGEQAALRVKEGFDMENAADKCYKRHRSDVRSHLQARIRCIEQSLGPHLRVGGDGGVEAGEDAKHEIRWWNRAYVNRKRPVRIKLTLEDIEGETCSLVFEHVFKPFRLEKQHAERDIGFFFFDQPDTLDRCYVHVEKVEGDSSGTVVKIGSNEINVKRLNKVVYQALKTGKTEVDLEIGQEKNDGEWEWAAYALVDISCRRVYAFKVIVQQGKKVDVKQFGCLGYATENVRLHPLQPYNPPEYVQDDTLDDFKPPVPPKPATPVAEVPPAPTNGVNGGIPVDVSNRLASIDVNLARIADALEKLVAVLPQAARQ